MTTVTGKLIGWTAGQRTEMKATLVDATGTPAVGYVASVPGELVRPVSITVGNEGAWTVDLTPNSVIQSDAGDTLWAIQEGRARDGAPIITYVAVPATGSYWAGDIRADLSDTLTGQSTVVYLAGQSGAAGASAYDVAVANGFEGSETEWLATLVGPQGEPGSGGEGGGAVDSVNGFTGVVVLDAADVNADPVGAASAAQTAAISAAATDATTRVSAHTAASDPHGDRAAAAAALAAHESDTTGVHGITNTAALETTSGSQAKADAVQAAASSALAAHVAATDPHGDRAAATSSLATHAGDTTDVHGITDTSLLETASGAQTKADAAQTAATSAAASDATAKVSAHVAASDPHGDRAAASTALAGHVAASDPHGDRAYADNKAAKAANLSDLASPSTARTNLGLGGAAVLGVGTGAGTVAAGDDSRITGAAQKASNLSDLASASTARTNLGLGGAAVLAVGTTTGTVAAGDDSRLSNSRTPTAHAASHASAGSDPVTLAQSQVTGLTAALAGLLPLAGGTMTGAQNATLANGTAVAEASLASGDTFDRYRRDASGRQEWGPGNAARDTTLYRSAADTLATDDSLAIGANLAVAGHALGQDTPAAHGIAAWCYDPALAVNSTELSNGVLYLVRVNIAAAVSVTKIYWWVGNSGSGATAGQNVVGLYSSAGTLLVSTNVDSAISSTGLKTTTITSQALTAGSWYWVGLLFNASIPPTLTRGSGWTGVDTAANLGLTAATYRFAKNGTGRTSMPSSITPASNTGTDFAGPWVAVGA